MTVAFYGIFSIFRNLSRLVWLVNKRPKILTVSGLLLSRLILNTLMPRRLLLSPLSTSLIQSTKLCAASSSAASSSRGIVTAAPASTRVRDSSRRTLSYNAYSRLSTPAAGGRSSRFGKVSTGLGALHAALMQLIYMTCHIEAIPLHRAVSRRCQRSISGPWRSSECICI